MSVGSWTSVKCETCLAFRLAKRAFAFTLHAQQSRKAKETIDELDVHTGNGKKMQAEKCKSRGLFYDYR